MNEKVLSDLIKLCWFNVIVCLILKLLGSNQFAIPEISSSIDNNLIAKNLIYLVLYVLNGFIFFRTLLKRNMNKSRAIIIIAINILLYLGFMVFSSLINFYSILEILILTIISFVFTKDKKIIIESIFVSAIFLLYQWLSLITKKLNVRIGYQTFMDSIIFQIDYYMLMLITLFYSIKKGGYLYELVCKFIWRRGKAILVFLTKRGSKEKRLQQVEENASSNKVEIGYWVYLVMLSFTQIMLVSVVCYFVYNTILNLLFIFISFVFLRARFGKSYHANTILKCTTLSILTFYIATRCSLPLNISLLSTVFVGLITAFIMHTVYYYTYFIKAKSDITKLPLEDLKIVLNNLDNAEINMLYDYWHRDKNTSVEDIAYKYGYSTKKIYRTIKKIKIE